MRFEREDAGCEIRDSRCRMERDRKRGIKISHPISHLASCDANLPLLRFSVADKFNDFVRGGRCEQARAYSGVTQYSADACKDGEMLRHGRRDEQEKQSGWRIINGAIRDALVVTAKNNDGVIHQTH